VKIRLYNRRWILRQADIGYSFPLFKSLEAGLYASLGYNGGQWLAEGVAAGFSDFNLGLSLSKDIGRFRAAAFANYTFVLLDAIGREVHFWFGFSFVCQGKERKEYRKIPGLRQSKVWVCADPMS